MDNGPLSIVPICNTKLSQDRLLQQPKLRPMHISSGVLGERPLTVLPQYGVLLPSSDILGCATHLHHFVTGARVAQGRQSATYLHLIFERHPIVFSNGHPNERLYSGSMALQAMNEEARAEMDGLFPGVLGVRHPNDRSDFYRIPAQLCVSSQSCLGGGITSKSGGYCPFVQLGGVVALACAICSMKTRLEVRGSQFDMSVQGRSYFESSRLPRKIPQPKKGPVVSV